MNQPPLLPGDRRAIMDTGYTVADFARGDHVYAYDPPSNSYIYGVVDYVAATKGTLKVVLHGHHQPRSGIPACWVMPYED